MSNQSLKSQNKKGFLRKLFYPAVLLNYRKFLFPDEKVKNCCCKDFDIYILFLFIINPLTSHKKKLQKGDEQKMLLVNCQ